MVLGKYLCMAARLFSVMTLLRADGDEPSRPIPARFDPGKLRNAAQRTANPIYTTNLLIPCQLPASPMLVFAGTDRTPLDVAI